MSEKSVCYARRPECSSSKPRDFDEVIARGVSSLHIERMHERGIWMGITMLDGNLYHLNFWNEGRAVLQGRLEFQGKDENGGIDRAAADRRDAAVRELAEKAEALATRLDEVTAASQGIFTMAAVHGAFYSGPDYGQQLIELRAAIRAVRELVPTEQSNL